MKVKVSLDFSPFAMSTRVIDQWCALSHTDGWESASLSAESDDDGEWVDVRHSSDEEQQEVVSFRIPFCKCVTQMFTKT